MKTLFLFVLASCFFAAAMAQTRDITPALFVFDKDWHGCKPEDAVYLGCLRKFNDTTYEWKYYNFKGPLISVETYKDKDNNIPHGLFAFYGTDGKLDSMGYTKNGKKHDNWTFYTDSLSVIRVDEYADGRLLRSKDTTALRKERDSTKEWSDQVVAQGLGIEASFKNGDAGWVKYVQNNINFPDRARNLGINGKVLIQFIVQTDGTLSGFFLRQSLEYSIDEEAIRLLKKSPKWIPARLNGKMVKAYRIQPLVFVIP